MKELKKFKMFNHRVYITLSEKEFKKALKKLDSPIQDIDKSILGLTHIDYDARIIIALISKRVLESPCDHRASTAAHEAYHVVKAIAENIGDEHLSEEATAYMVGYITRKIMEEIIDNEGK